MRLSILDHGHRRRAKAFFALTSRKSGVASPDIVKLLLYRPGLFARPLLALTADAMRGPSYWTAGEREYLAMSTAKLHECPFCAVTHAELVRIAATGEIDPDDPRSARPELEAVRAFLETVSQDPDRADAAGVAGVPRQAVVEALRVNLVWNVVNRLANAFGFVLREGQLETGTRSLHRFGYRFPGFLVAEGHYTDLGEVAQNLRHSVLHTPGATGQAIRSAALLADELPQPLQAYATTVRDASYKITDADIDELTAAGYSEDAIFEVTAAAAVGAALASYDAGLRAIGE
ncbi:carboxymuconolactone decarboxylase family protein [Amycolatopsis samaneae]|uniref:Alkylhydroperoxidase AhpD family core domain-containing protein n=1 Tax=Amycolatopsis samaneae TaxID=664691 RepID=A0ABW5GX51_9PSEU